MDGRVPMRQQKFGAGSTMELAVGGRGAADTKLFPDEVLARGVNGRAA